MHAMVIHSKSATMKISKQPSPLLVMCVIVVILGLIKTTNGYFCYTCRSSGKDGYCWLEKQKDERTPMIQCPTGWCITITEVPVESEDKKPKPVSTVRNCAMRNTEKLTEGCIYRISGSLNITTCFCKSPECNNKQTIFETT